MFVIEVFVLCVILSFIFPFLIPAMPIIFTVLIILNILRLFEGGDKGGSANGNEQDYLPPSSSERGKPGINKRNNCKQDQKSTVRPKRSWKVLDFYDQWGFDMLPVDRDGKSPMEERWLEISHKNKAVWTGWLKRGLNLGLKTGSVSNVTAIDIDTKKIPDVFWQASSLRQETQRGWHFIFQYEPDLPSGGVRKFKIDILNDGKQIVVPPSTVDGYARKWDIVLDESVDPPKMSDSIKRFLLSEINEGDFSEGAIFSETLDEDEENDSDEFRTEDVNWDENGPRRR